MGNINANVVQNKSIIKANIMTIPSATTEHKGIIRIATENEALSGIDNFLAITPFTLKEFVDTNALSIDTSYGYRIELSLNDETYVLTATLKDQNGDVLNSATVDFPIESVFVDGRYDSATKTLIFELESGVEINVPIGDLIEGLQNEITSENPLDADLVDDTTAVHKFVSAEEKAQITTNKNDIISLDNKYDSITGGLSDSITALDSVVSSNYTTLDNKIDSVNGALSDSINALDSVVSANYNTLDGKIDSINGALSDSITGLDTKYDSITGALDTKIDNHIGDTLNPHSVTKAQVGLGNCDNTSDANKPISTATQTALDGKVDKNTAITGATKCKITYDTKGLVTSGADLQASDIPSLTLSKISDVTASAAEVNILDGATLSTTELNYVDGVTSSIQTQLNNKLEQKPDGTNDLIDSNNKINLLYVPDVLLGQVLYAGVFNATTAVATLTTNAKTKLGTTANTITLTNDTTAITGYEDNEGCFYICNTDGTFANISFLVGDWLLSTGSGWSKVDNTDAVTGVKGGAESTYRIGNVNLTASDVGALPDNTTIGDATLTIQVNSSTVDTFTANATSNKSINIQCATPSQGSLADTALQPNDNISELTNNAGYITNSALNGYATETYVDTGLATKQDVLNAGSGISISSGGSVIPLTQALPYTFNSTRANTNFVSSANFDTTKERVVILEVPIDVAYVTFYLNGVDARYGIVVKNTGLSDIYVSDGSYYEQYNTTSFPVSGSHNYLKFVIDTDNKTDIYYGYDNSTWTLLLSKTRSNQRDDTWTNGVNICNDETTGWSLDYLYVAYAGESGISCDNTIARVSDLPTNNNQLTNGAGYITSSALNGYATESFVTSQGYITGITSGDVTTALGYTPYNSSNPNGYQANVIETVKVNGTALTVTSKAVDVTVPTKVSDLTDDTATYPIDKADTLTGLTASVTELNYCDGVTSAIQTQLNGKLTTSDIVSSVSSSSTNSKAVGAKLFYDTCGDIETLINAL